MDDEKKRTFDSFLMFSMPFNVQKFWSKSEENVENLPDNTFNMT